MSESSSHRTSESSPPPPFIVGIGASAGGLEAIEQLFAKMPVDSGLAFVVVQHLSPNFKSLMDELLARITKIPIFQVEDGTRVRANTIHLMPHKVEMIVSDGRLLLTDKDPDQGLALPIDKFFRSLAQDAESRAIAVVLSGTGSDGSRGIRDIHEAGGLVLVQNLETAKFDGMPRSAIDTGVCDQQLSPPDIARAILECTGHAVDWTESEAFQKLPETALQVIFRLLKDSFGVNFSHYKSGTIHRRIDRRREMMRQECLDDYVQLLSNDSAELQQLHEDLLIGVTEFFRDEEAWETLGNEGITKLLQTCNDGEEIRAWVAGCSTGQEAYSLAHLFLAKQRELGTDHRVRIFATDLDQKALSKAATGLYAEADLVDMSAQRRDDLFRCQEDGFKVHSELRKMIVFAPHDLLADAPFTRLHLITCRNLLIYLNPDSQRRILSLFHFGLRTDGVLFLGPSESLAELVDEMFAINEPWKLYRKQRNLPLPERTRLKPRPPVITSPVLHKQSTAERMVRSEILGTYDRLLDEFMPCSLLVNERLELIQVFGKASRFLSLADGRFSGRITDLIAPDLSLALTGLLQRARDSQEKLELRNVRIAVPEGEEQVAISVQEIQPRDSRIRSWLIVFRSDSGHAIDAAQASVEVDPADFTRVGLLEQTLTDTRENLQSTIEALEVSNEELHATNEEMVAANEELQSTNEELNSVNEELYTVNTEHQNKIGELVNVTNDLENLLRSTDIGTIFLDHELRIRRYTPAAAAYCKLRPHDIDRPFDSLANHLVHDSLMADLKTVMRTGERIEAEVQDREDRYLLLRMLPYLASMNVQGVVLAIIDITPQKTAMLKYERTATELDELYRTAPVGLAVMDTDLRYLRINEYLAAINGKSVEDHIGRHLLEAVPELADKIIPMHQQVMQTGKATELTEVNGVTSAAPTTARTWLVRYHPIKAYDEVVAVSAIVTDVTAMKQSERRLLEKSKELQRSNRDLEEFAYAASHDLQEPLRTIATYCEAIDEDYREKLDEEGVQFLNFVVDATRRMRNQISGLLEYSRIGRAPRKFGPVNLSQVFNDVCHDLSTAIDEAGAVVECEKLPVVQGDQRLLHALLQNLIANSIKFRATERNPKIHVSAEETDSHWQLSLTDNGIGIDIGQSERIFQVFQRLHSATEYPGTGIGLSLCKRIVELHGGTIALEESAGMGSRFVFSLDRTRD